MQKGNIGITTENIFPIIKQFLYSDHDIFIREIISNAVGAIKKLESVDSSKITEPLIKVIIDTVEKTITVRDNGIGMTKDEIKKYINQIAFSGASDFLEKYKDTQIIGHFGLGFYSSFMVSDKVEIITKSYKDDEKAQHWVCEGNPAFVLKDTKKDSIGTDVIMHIGEDFKEYLDQDKIKKLLDTFCKFIGVKIEISCDDKDVIEVESLEPMWVKKPSELTKEDYLEFYRKLYPGKEDPLYWLHLNVDYPFNLTGILYFPSIKSNPIIDKTNISLYCNEVFVTKDVSNILPEFLTLLHGVIDSPDIPLNVSRSYLQSDSNVKKINKYIINKVVSSLKDQFNSDREKYNENWKEIETFMHVGVISEEGLFDKMKDIFLLKDYKGNLYTIDDYTELVKGNQTDKDGNLVWLFTFDPDMQYTYIKEAEKLGYSVLLFNNQFTTYIINVLETKLEKLKIYRIDANTLNKLINKNDDEEDSKKLSYNDTKLLIDLFSSQLKNDFDAIQLSVKIEALDENALPIMITADEQSRRMKELSFMNPNFAFFRKAKQQMAVVFNTNSNIVQLILKEAKEHIGEEYDELVKKVSEFKDNLDLLKQTNKDKKPEEIDEIDKDAEKQYNDSITKTNAEISDLVAKYTKDNDRIKQLLDIAYLQNGLLQKEDFINFINRSIKILCNE